MVQKQGLLVMLERAFAEAVSVFFLKGESLYNKL